jgi:hypothetical protein
MGNSRSEHEFSLVSLVDPDDVDTMYDFDDIETVNAVKFLLLKDRKKTMQQIAEYFGYKDRSSVYAMIAWWESSGVMEKATKILLSPKVEEIRAVHSRVIDRWPLIVERQVKTAIHSRSDHVALEAAAWLKREIIDPALARQEEAGHSEQAYAESAGAFAPTVVEMPAFLVDEARKERERAD